MTGRLPPSACHGGRRDGFTLVEVLAAFVVLALLTVAIQRSVVSAAWSTARAGERVAAEAVAATLLDGPLSGTENAPGAGRLDGFDWAMRVEPLPPERFGTGAGPDETAAGWVPVRVTVEVRKAGRRQIAATAETIRLVRAAP